jgi:hypothetical protein
LGFAEQAETQIAQITQVDADCIRTGTRAIRNEPLSFVSCLGMLGKHPRQLKSHIRAARAMIPIAAPQQLRDLRDLRDLRRLLEFQMNQGWLLIPEMNQAVTSA